MRRRDVAAWVGCLVLWGATAAWAQAPDAAARAKLRARIAALRAEVELLRMEHDADAANLEPHLSDLRVLEDDSVQPGIAAIKDLHGVGDDEAQRILKVRTEVVETKLKRLRPLVERKTREFAAKTAALHEKVLELEDLEAEYRAPVPAAKVGGHVDPSPRPGEGRSVGAVPLAGFDPRILAYFSGDGAPQQTPGRAPSFEGKKVVVLTTAAPTALAADFRSIDRDLNRELVAIFRGGYKKIEIVDAKKVYDWDEAHPTWSDAGEIAKAFDADYVAFFEVQGFSVRDPRSPGLLEGNAEVNFRVTEYAHPKKENGKPNTAAPKEVNQVYEDAVKTTFPKNAPIAIETGVSPFSFKAKFLKLVANEISWSFLGRNPGDDIAPDQRF